MILIITLIVVFFLSLLFFWGPDIVNSVLVVTDEWREIFREIRDRRS